MVYGFQNKFRLPCSKSGLFVLLVLYFVAGVCWSLFKLDACAATIRLSDTPNTDWYLDVENPQNSIKFVNERCFEWEWIGFWPESFCEYVFFDLFKHVSLLLKDFFGNLYDGVILNALQRRIVHGNPHTP